MENKYTHIERYRKGNLIFPLRGGKLKSFLYLEKKWLQDSTLKAISRKLHGRV
jgi:hypothetical protein